MRLSKKISILSIFLIFIILIYWLLTDNRISNKKEIKSKNISKLRRDYSKLTKLEEIQITKECSDIENYKDQIFLKLEENSDNFHFIKLDMLKKESYMRVTDQDLNVAAFGIDSIGNMILFMTENQDEIITEGDDQVSVLNSKSSNCVLLYSTKDYESKVIVDNLPFSINLGLNSNMLLYTKVRDNLTFLYKFYLNNNKLDSINLNEFYKSSEKNLDFIISGNFIFSKSMIYFYPMYSSRCFKFNRDIDATSFQTIDSMPLPEIEIQTTDNFSSYKVKPEIFVNIKQKYLKYSKLIANLSYLSMEIIQKKEDKNSAVLDIYDDNNHYKKSYVIPSLKSKYSALSFCINELDKVIYVLYNDYRTIVKFKLNEHDF